MAFHKILLYKGGSKMKTAKLVWLIIAICLVLIGATICFTSIKSIDFDFKKFNTMEYTTKTHTVTENFADISILAAECDVEFKLSDDGTCKIECLENERLSHFIEVKENKLVIERIDNRKWYEHIGIYNGEIHLTVYLPNYSYNSLVLSTLSGDINITKDFAFENAEIITTSGDVSFTARVNEKLKLSSNSGEIVLGPIITKNVEIDTTSGDITIENVKCDNVNLCSTSGEISLNQVKVNGDMQIKTTSGDIELEYSDAKELYLQSTSGDIDGILLTPKIFSVKTTSGDVSVPNSNDGGKCQIKTTSGDIDVQIKTVCWVN